MTDDDLATDKMSTAIWMVMGNVLVSTGMFLVVMISSFDDLLLDMIIM